MTLSQRMYKLRQIWKKLLCKQPKSLVSLKQLGRLLNKNIIDSYKSIGFKQLYKDSSILIRQTKNEISIVSIYINDFFLSLNAIIIFKVLKKLLGQKYKMRDFKKIKIIISQQITTNLVVRTMKIDQSVFIKDFIIEKGLEIAMPT